MPRHHVQHWQCWPQCWGMGTGDWFVLGGVNFLPRGFSGARLGFGLEMGGKFQEAFFLSRAKAFPVPCPASPVRGLGEHQEGGETQLGQVTLTSPQEIPRSRGVRISLERGGRRRKGRMLEVMAFVSPSHHCLGCSPAHLGIDEHPPACGKQRMNSWFCFLAFPSPMDLSVSEPRSLVSFTLWILPWSHGCSSDRAGSISSNGTGHEGQVPEKETRWDAAVGCCHCNKYGDPQSIDRVRNRNRQTWFYNLPSCLHFLQAFESVAGNIFVIFQVIHTTPHRTHSWYEENYVIHHGFMSPENTKVLIDYLLFEFRCGQYRIQFLISSAHGESTVYSSRSLHNIC